jgi:hypothetical protein
LVEAQINLYNADIQNFNDVSEISFSTENIWMIFLQNLISNALKYKSSDKILLLKLKLEKMNGDIVLSVPTMLWG